MTVCQRWHVLILWKAPFPARGVFAAANPQFSQCILVNTAWRSGAWPCSSSTLPTAPYVTSRHIFLTSTIFLSKAANTSRIQPFVAESRLPTARSRQPHTMQQDHGQRTNVPETTCASFEHPVAIGSRHVGSWIFSGRDPTAGVYLIWPSAEVSRPSRQSGVRACGTSLRYLAMAGIPFKEDTVQAIVDHCRHLRCLKVPVRTSLLSTSSFLNRIQRKLHYLSELAISDASRGAFGAGHDCRATLSSNVQAPCWRFGGSPVPWYRRLAHLRLRDGSRWTMSWMLLKTLPTSLFTLSLFSCKYFLPCFFFITVCYICSPLSPSFSSSLVINIKSITFMVYPQDSHRSLYRAFLELTQNISRKISVTDAIYFAWILFCSILVQSYSSFTSILWQKKEWALSLKDREAAKTPLRLVRLQFWPFKSWDNS